MMRTGQSKDDIVLSVTTYNGQEKELSFKTLDDLETFMATDFEVTKIECTDKVDLFELRSIIKNQSIMDVSRNAIIGLNRRIEDKMRDETVSKPSQTGKSSDRDPYDFKIHESQIRVI